MSRKREDKSRAQQPPADKGKQPRTNHKSSTGTNRSTDKEEQQNISGDPSDPMAIREPGKPPSWGRYDNIF
jgi:hypothetical protein